MGILTFLIVGLISGWIASLMVGGHGYGVLRDILIGIVGAVIGGFVFNMAGVVSYGFWGAVATSVVGAIIFLGTARLFISGPRHV